MSGERTLLVPEEVDVGDRIRLALLAAGRTPDELAVAVGFSVRTYQRILKGTRKVKRAELIAIAQFTGQDLSFFGASSGGGRSTLPLPPGIVKPDDELVRSA